jgi:hypothetical protein
MWLLLLDLVQRRAARLSCPAAKAAQLAVMFCCLVAQALLLSVVL